MNPAIESMLRFFLYGPGASSSGQPASMPEKPKEALQPLPDAKKKTVFQPNFSSPLGAAPKVDGVPGAALDG